MSINNNSDTPTIPTIYLQSTNETETVATLRSACETIGFFYLRLGSDGDGKATDQHDTNTNGIATQADLEHTIQQVFHQSKALFELPSHIKTSLSDPILSRGYTAMGEETLDPKKQTRGDTKVSHFVSYCIEYPKQHHCVTDTKGSIELLDIVTVAVTTTKEGYYIGTDIPPTSPHYNPSKLAGPNIWPDQNHHNLHNFDGLTFQNQMMEYHTLASKIAMEVVRLLALAIGLNKHHFDQDFDRPMALLRLLHYSAEPSDPERGVYACGAHSDYGMITLLLTEENVDGLQILLRREEEDGEEEEEEVWMDVPPPPIGTFIVNLGDMLERWTNGRFQSTVHRVLIRDGGDGGGGDEKQKKDRYSVPFFFEPNFDTVVECLDVCCDDEGNPPKYPPITSGQFLLDKYKETHADFEPVV